MHSILLDVDGAFQLPVNKQDVYMKFPTGMKQVTGKVLKLDHSMNGTKQSAFNWHELADKLLLDIGFNPTINDSCLYSRYLNVNYVWLVCMWMISDVLLMIKMILQIL